MNGIKILDLLFDLLYPIVDLKIDLNPTGIIAH